jgi:protein-L-isoaspartate O-methyltransferase
MIPVDEKWAGQMVYLVNKDENGNITKKPITPVRFVPLTSKEIQEKEEF